ncbi:MAG: tetratricopeptide repeat protein [Planctomycetota bacterium]|nr:tetratricopeptide repeat protein [Planctomycetota bacterium]
MEMPLRHKLILPGLLLATLLSSCQDSDSGYVQTPPEVAALGRLMPSILEDLNQATEKVVSDPKNWDLWAQLGVRYEVHSTYGPARTCYAVAAKHIPENPRWPYRAAIVSGRLGDATAALRWIDRSIQLDAAYPTSYYRKGNWLLELGRLDEARDAYQKAADLAPKQSETWAGLARVAMQADQPDEALRQIKKARKLSSSDPYLHLLFGIILTQLGRDSEAQVHLELGQGSSPSVTDPWSRVVAVGRTAEHDLLERGNAMEAKGDFSGAIRAYREVIARRPGEVKMPLKLARTLLRAGRDDESMKLVEETLIEYPTHLDLLMFYGALLSKKNDMAGAWDACNRALEASPDRPDAYILKSSLLAREGKIQEALDAATLAVDKDPSSSRAYEVLAQRYSAAKQPWDAVRVLETAYKQDGFKPSARFYRMLMDGLTALKRQDKLPAVLQRAQADYGTKAFPK